MTLSLPPSAGTPHGSPPSSVSCSSSGMRQRLHSLPFIASNSNTTTAFLLPKYGNNASSLLPHWQQDYGTYATPPPFCCITPGPQQCYCSPGVATRVGNDHISETPASYLLHLHYRFKTTLPLSALAPSPAPRCFYHGFSASDHLTSTLLYQQ